MTCSAGWPSAAELPAPAPHGICPAQTDTGKAGWRAVHCHSLGGGGCQRLCPSGLAMSTPQTFPHGLPGLLKHPARKFPPQRHTAGRTAPGPSPPDLSRCQSQGRNNAGSSRTPFRHARRTRPIWQYWHVPALSGLLPPSPAPPGSGCPQLHRPAATGRRRRSLTSTRNDSASRRRPDI